MRRMLNSRRLCDMVVVFIAIVLCFIILPTQAEAVVIDSGACSDTVNWSLDSDGTLTVSGEGAIPNYDWDNYDMSWIVAGQYSPWYNRRALIKAVVIEEGITEIGWEAFYCLDNLTKVTIGDGVTSIGSSAFSSCDNLKEITIPASVTDIGFYPFSGCSSLTDVYISDLVSWCNINFNSDYATPMASATNLYLNGEKITGELIIPEGVKKIPCLAFNGCDITRVVIPASATSVHYRAFDNCKALVEYVVLEENLNYSAKDGVLYNKSQTELIDVPEGLEGSAVLPESLLFVGDYGFENCELITKITLPDGVLSIGVGAFEGCSDLTDINIPDTVMDIGWKAFGDCTKLAGVVIPEGPTTVDSWFWGCTSLKSFRIPKSVTRIEGRAFSDCTSLELLLIPDSIEYIDDSWAFTNCYRWHTLYAGDKEAWSNIMSNNNTCFVDSWSRFWPTHYNCTGNEEIDPVNKVCSICVANCAHNWDNGVITSQPVVDKEGIKTYTCSKCRGTKTEIVHNRVNGICTACGDIYRHGWIFENNKWYYYQDNTMQTGWLKSGNTWYYLQSSGAMATGWCKIGNTYYYFAASGAMQTGWLKSGNTWYYLQSSGAMATGWCKIGNTYYYFASSGAMQTGWLKSGNTWYYLQSSGAMATGWCKIGNTWYYLQSSGAMATGSLKIGAKTYYFNASGSCLNP